MKQLNVKSVIKFILVLVVSSAFMISLFNDGVRFTEVLALMMVLLNYYWGSSEVDDGNKADKKTV